METIMRQKLRELIDAIELGLRKLNELQFSAPWKPRTGGC